MPLDDTTDLTPVYDEAGRQNGIDPALLRAQTHVESTDNDYAISSAGAEGRSQFIPSTAARMGLRNPFDPREAIPAQARLLRENLDKFGSLDMAVAAYHGGTDPSQWGDKTRDYWKRVADVYAQHKAAQPKEADDWVTPQQATPASAVDDWAVPDGKPLTNREAVKQLPAALTEAQAPLPPIQHINQEPPQQPPAPGIRESYAKSNEAIGNAIVDAWNNSPGLLTPEAQSWLDKTGLGGVTRLADAVFNSGPSVIFAGGLEALNQLGGRHLAEIGEAEMTRQMGETGAPHEPTPKVPRAAAAEPAGRPPAEPHPAVAPEVPPPAGPAAPAAAQPPEAEPGHPMLSRLAKQAHADLAAIAKDEGVEVPQFEEAAAPAAAGVGPPSAAPTTGTPAPEAPVAQPRTMEEAALAELDPDTHAAAADAHDTLREIAKEEGVEVPPMPKPKRTRKAAPVAEPPTEAAPEPPVAEPAAQPGEQFGPPPPVGTTRFYHGGEERGGGSRWLTPDLNYAQGYAAKAAEPRVSYVDIPNDSPVLQKAFEDEGSDMKAPFVHFEAPPEIAAQLKPIEPAGPPAPPWQRPGLTERERLGPPEAYGPPAPAEPDVPVPPMTPLQERHAQVSAAEAERSQAEEQGTLPTIEVTPKPQQRGTTPFEAPPKEPQRLIDFLRSKTILAPGTIHEHVIPGGIRDAGGDLRAILGGSKGRPGLINNASGMSLHDKLIQAWENGFLPEYGEEPPTDDRALLDAIRDDHMGTARYSMHDQDAVEAYQSATEGNREIDRLASEHGIETRGKTRDQFFDELHDTMSMDERAQEIASQDAAHEAAYREAEQAAKQWGAEQGVEWNPRELYGTSQARTLEDLEREHAEEAQPHQAAPAPSERAAGEPESGPPGADQGAVPEGGGPRRGGAGDADRGAGAHNQADVANAPPSPGRVAPPPPDLPLVKHTTKRGKVLEGVVRSDIDYAQAKALDPYTFKKDGGWFIRKEPAIAAVRGEPAPPIEAAASPRAAVQDVADAERVALQQRRTQAERLRAGATTLAEKAEGDLGRDRNANTARRARMAASSVADANARARIAETMNNIAAAIEDGETVHLAGVTSRASVEALDQALRQGLYENARRDTSPGNWEQKTNRPATEADARLAKLPDAGFHLAVAKDLAQSLPKRGFAQTIKWIEGLPAAQTYVHPTPEQRLRLAAAVKAVPSNHAAKRIKEALADRERFIRMGIDSDEKLHEALTEYLNVRGGTRVEDPIKRLERQLVGQKGIGVDFFPTPPGLVQNLVREADIKPRMRALEPSAGKGDIADALKEAGAQVDIIELSSTLRQILEAKGHNLVGTDFLDYRPTQGYDRIVMNPPFSDRLDAAHVEHAYDMLNPGGRLVAITGEGLYFGADKKAQQFRDWLKETGGSAEKLPDGSFKSAFRPTGVATRMVVIDKAEEPAAPAADLLGKPVAEPRAKTQPEPTIRNDTRQEAMPGMESSAVQAQAARDAQGRGALQAEAPQKPADEGLFAPDTSGQGTLYAGPGAVFDPAAWRRAFGPFAPAAIRAVTWAKRGTDAIANGLAPMRTGSVRAQAWATDFANSLRQVNFHYGEIDRDIERKYKPSERADMGAAMDAQSVLEQQLRDMPAEQQAAARAQFDAGGTGLAGLRSDQQRVLRMLDTVSQSVWERMRQRGMVSPQARGLPFYFPRQILTWSEENGFERPGGARAGSGRNIAPVGGNLTTQGPMRREHLRPEETEAAAQSKFGPGAAILTDIRMLPSRLAQAERAIAGVDLMSQIERVGNETGVNLVTRGDIPGLLNPADYFTIEQHPSFRQFTGTGWKAIHVSKEFEGPLRAVLTKSSGDLYRGAMALKSGVMSAIMYSPFIHLAVELGRSLPVMPLRVMTLQALRDGSRLRADMDYMDRATTDGLAPLGRQGWRTDPISLADQANDQGGNRFVRAIREMRDNVARGTGAVLGQTARDIIQHPHQTLLWDQVFNLQVGLYDGMRNKWIEKGYPPEVAGQMAAHIANRYAGALPPEHLARGANMAANMLLFSRSFTLGNLGVMKDMLTGAPGHLVSRLQQMAGPEVAASAQSAMRRKAIAAFTMDIGMFYMANGLLQSGLQVLRNASSQGGLGPAAQQTFNDWYDEATSAVQSASNNPLSIFGVLPQHWNEPGKQDRVYAGTDDQQRGIYLRLPAGKVGEEFLGWFAKPGTMLVNKASPLVRPIIEDAIGYDSLGRAIYKPNPQTMMDYIENAGAAAKHIAEGLGPTSTIQGVAEEFKHHVMGEPAKGDTGVSAMKVLGPMTGLAQVSSGFPGGPAAGELHAQSEREKYELQKAMPAIRDKIKAGDTEGAMADMVALNVPPQLRRYYIRQTLRPGPSKGAMKRLPNAPGDVQERVRRQLQQAQPQDQP